MRRFTNHREPWGEFIDIKVNAPQILERELQRAKRGVVALSTVTDPYQPIEREYRITRKCLELLLRYQYSINLLTRSPLCLRDMDLFKEFKEIEVGLTITTHDEGLRRIFEPRSPSIFERVRTLEILSREGIKTYVFIGPILPMNPIELVRMLDGLVEEVFIDRMNYPFKVASLYRKAQLERYLEDDYFHQVGLELKRRFEEKGIWVTMCY
jgi:DNA repair photolyase